MANFRNHARKIALAAGLAGAAMTGGCSGFDGVELNGKIFDAIGMSGDTFGKKTEPKTQARAPLVLPPDQNRLPEPGSAGNTIQTGALQAEPSWPRDPDAQRVAEGSAKQKAQDQFCKDGGNWRQKAMRDEVGATMGPGGKCQGSIFDVISDTVTGKKKE